jgi:aminomethyltransferase
LPCGLGARDVLRLEAALPLHGHEIDAATSPIEAGLERFVRPEGQFVGAEILRRQREQGVARTLVGLQLPGRSAPRAGYAIQFQGQEVGRVTSGTYSPTLDTSIAMGYVLVAHAAPGQNLTVDMRGRATPVEVVPLPFYTRSRRSP